MVQADAETPKAKTNHIANPDAYLDEMMEEQVKSWQNGDFAAKLEIEKNHQMTMNPDIPFLIWEKVENPKTKNNPRSIPIVTPFVQHLNQSNGTLQHVIRYFKKGMKIAFYNIPLHKSAEDERKLGEIRKFCEQGDLQAAAIEARIRAELGMEKKIADEKAKLKAAKPNQEDAK